jgi:hypothetical protein
MFSAIDNLFSQLENSNGIVPKKATIKSEKWRKCLSPLNDWTDFLIQFRTLNLGNHEYKTSKLEC